MKRVNKTTKSGYKYSIINTDKPKRLANLIYPVLAFLAGHITVRLYELLFK